jgi:Zn-dependent alcohol dehydrogenase
MNMIDIVGAVLTRAGVPGAHQPLMLERLQLADPQPSELLVKIDAAGLCHSDLSVMDGTRPRPLPMALGHEATGVVEAVGDAVADIAVGGRVVLTFVPACGRCARCLGKRPALCDAAATANTEGRLLAGGRRLFGAQGVPINHHLGVSAFATHAIVDRASVVPVDHDVPATVAALFGCAVLTGAGAVMYTANVQAGESVVVFGLGGIGLAAVMAAATQGAATIVAVDPVAAKRELARSVGATHVASHAEVAALLKDLRPGGVDVVIEAVGKSAVLEAAFEMAARGGRIVAVGLPHPSEVIRISAARLVGESKALLGSYLGDTSPQRDVPRFVALWRSGRFPVERLLSETLPLSDINRGFDKLAAGTTVRTVVTPD